MFGIETARNYIELAKANKGASVYELDVDRLRSSGKLGRMAVDRFTDQVFEIAVGEMGLKPEFAEPYSCDKMKARDGNFTLLLGRDGSVGLTSKLDSDPLMPEESPESHSTRSYTLSGSVRESWDELTFMNMPVGYCSRGFIELPYSELIDRIAQDCKLAMNEPVKFSRQTRENVFGVGNLVVGTFQPGSLGSAE